MNERLVTTLCGHPQPGVRPSTAQPNGAWSGAGSSELDRQDQQMPPTSTACVRSKTSGGGLSLAVHTVTGPGESGRRRPNPGSAGRHGGRSRAAVPCSARSGRCRRCPHRTAGRGGRWSAPCLPLRARADRSGPSRSRGSRHRRAWPAAAPWRPGPPWPAPVASGGAGAIPARGGPRYRTDGLGFADEDARPTAVPGGCPVGRAQAVQRCVRRIAVAQTRAGPRAAPVVEALRPLGALGCVPVSRSGTAREEQNCAAGSILTAQ